MYQNESWINIKVTYHHLLTQLFGISSVASYKIWNVNNLQTLHWLYKDNGIWLDWIAFLEHKINHPWSTLVLNYILPYLVYFWGLSHLYKYIAKSSTPWQGLSLRLLCKAFTSSSVSITSTEEHQRPVLGPISPSYRPCIPEKFTSLLGRLLWVCYKISMSLNLSFFICKVEAMIPLFLRRQWREETQRENASKGFTIVPGPQETSRNVLNNHIWKVLRKDRSSGKIHSLVLKPACHPGEDDRPSLCS